MEPLKKSRLLSSILLLFLFLISLGSKGQSVVFQETTFKRVKEMAKEQDRIIFVDAYTKWCKPCIKMDREVFADKEVADFFNRTFVNLKVDLENSIGERFKDAHQVVALPTLFFFDQYGKLLGRTEGALTKGELMDAAKKIGDPQYQMGSLKSKIDSGIATVDDYYHYAAGLKAANFPYEDVVAKYLEIQGDTFVLEGRNAEVIFKWLSDIRHPYYPLFSQNLEYFREKYGFGMVQAKLKQDGELAYKEAMITLDEQQLESAKDFNYEFNPIGAEKNALTVSMRFFSHKKEWDHFGALAVAYVERFLLTEEVNAFTAIEIYNISADFDVYVNDLDLLLKAKSWLQQVLKVRNEHYVYETYASILSQLGDKGGAISACKKAIDIGNRWGHDTTSAKNLLNLLMQ